MSRGLGDVYKRQINNKPKKAKIDPTTVRTILAHKNKPNDLNNVQERTINAIPIIIMTYFAKPF